MNNKVTKRQWSAEKVARVLHESAYTGRYTWRKAKRVIDPATGKYRRSPVPKEDWVEEYMPQLNIIEEAVWQKAKDSFKSLSRCNGHDRFRKKQHARYLLSGLSYCGDCGGTFPALYTGTRYNGQFYGYYGCRRTYVDRLPNCPNSTKYPLKVLDERVLRAVIARYGSSDYLSEKVESIISILREFISSTFTQEARQNLTLRIAELEMEKRDIQTMLSAGKLSGTGAKSLAEVEGKIAGFRELEILPLPDYLPSAEEIITFEVLSKYYQDLLGKLRSENTSRTALADILARINVRASKNGIEVELVENAEDSVRHLLSVIAKYLPHTRHQLGSLLVPCMRGSFRIEVEYPPR